MKNFFLFICKPNSTSSTLQARNTKQSVGALAWMIFLGALIFALHLLLNAALEHASPLWGIQKPSMNTDIAGKLLQEPLLFALKACLLAPLVEEAAFRLGLTFKKWQVAAMVVWATFIALSFFLSPSESKWVGWAIRLAAGCIAGALFWLIVKQPALDKLKLRYTGAAVYLTSILFGFLHITNYETLYVASLPFYLLYALNLSFSGLQFAYIRLHLGFAYSCLLHGIFNFIPLFIAYLLVRYG